MKTMYNPSKTGILKALDSHYLFIPMHLAAPEDIAGAVDWEPPEEAPPPLPSEDDVAEKVRTERNRLITASDWTQVADAPVDQAAWAEYRQALRAIPQQAGFPHDVAWPVKP